jgi:hypothetical protein
MDRALRAGPGKPDLRVAALVAARLDPAQREKRFAARLLDVHQLIGLLAEQWDRPKHAQLVLDVTATHLATVNHRLSSQERTSLLATLRAHNHLAPALRLRYPKSDPDQIAALTVLLDAVYPRRLDEATVRSILTPAARTPALLMVVVGKTDDPKLKAWIANLLTGTFPTLRRPPAEGNS